MINTMMQHHHQQHTYSPNIPIHSVLTTNRTMNNNYNQSLEECEQNVDFEENYSHNVSTVNIDSNSSYSESYWDLLSTNPPMNSTIGVEIFNNSSPPSNSSPSHFQTHSTRTKYCQNTPIIKEEENYNKKKKTVPEPTTKPKGKNLKKVRNNKCSRWTPKENKKLIEAYTKYKGRNWKDIAKYVGDKTSNQCNQHWHRVLNPEIIKKPWTEEEDSILIRCVQKYGESSWKQVSQELKGRTDIQCRHRWTLMRKYDGKSNNYRSYTRKSTSSLLSSPVEMNSPVSNDTTEDHTMIAVSGNNSTFNCGPSMSNKNHLYQNSYVNLFVDINSNIVTHQNQPQVSLPNIFLPPCGNLFGDIVPYPTARPVYQNQLCYPINMPSSNGFPIQYSMTQLKTVPANTDLILDETNSLSAINQVEDYLL
jgi:hypothetical protein